MWSCNLLCVVFFIKITTNPPIAGTSPVVPWPWAAAVTVTNRGEHSDVVPLPPPVPVQHHEQLETGRGCSVQRYLRKIVISGIPAGLSLPVPLATTTEGFPKALQDSSAEVTGRRWLEWGWQHGGPSEERSLCVEVDRLDFSRQDLGNLHRDDLGHHFWVVHAHHVCLD